VDIQNHQVKKKIYSRVCVQIDYSKSPIAEEGCRTRA